MECVPITTKYLEVMNKMLKSKKSRGVLIGASIAATAALVLSGCSGGNSSDDSSSGKVTLNMWSWNPDATSNVQYLKAFEDANPNIKVKFRFIQNQDYYNALKLGLTSGQGPDVFGVQVGSFADQIAPLAEDLAPYAKKALGSDWKDQLTATDQLTAKGKQVGLPWMITGGGLMWANQTLVDSLGLTVPTTMAELKSFCKAVEAAKKICMDQGAADAFQNLDVYQTIINQIAPGKFYEAITGKSSFDTPDFVQAFDVWKSFFTNGIFEKGALGVHAYPDANDAQKKGDAALIAMGSWQNADTTSTRLADYAKTYGSAFNKDTIFMPYFFPQVVANGKTGTMFGGPDVGFGVSASSKHKDAAAKLVLWLTASKAGQGIMAKTVQQPALKSVPLDLSDVVNDAQKEALKQQGPALADMIGQRQIKNADVQTALSDALSNVASGQQKSADAAKSVQAAIKKALG